MSKSKSKTQGQKLKIILKTDVCINDISNKEFDTYYLKCQQRKHLNNISNTIFKKEDFAYGNESDVLDNVFKESNDIEEMEIQNFMNDYDDYLTNEEIDAAFEEAEKWSDF